MSANNSFRISGLTSKTIRHEGEKSKNKNDDIINSVITIVSLSLTREY